MLGSFKDNACRLLEEAAYSKSELEKSLESLEENLFQVFLCTSFSLIKMEVCITPKYDTVEQIIK